MIDETTPWHALDDEVLGPQDKSLPPAAWGRRVREFLDPADPRTQWQTPLLTLDRGRLDANVTLMAEWADRRGRSRSPRTARRRWRRGCGRDSSRPAPWGITLATPWQVQLARSFGVDRIMLANALVDPAALAWLAAELAQILVRVLRLGGQRRKPSS